MMWKSIVLTASSAVCVSAFGVFSAQAGEVFKTAYVASQGAPIQPVMVGHFSQENPWSFNRSGSPVFAGVLGSNRFSPVRTSFACREQAQIGPDGRVNPNFSLLLMMGQCHGPRTGSRPVTVKVIKDNTALRNSLMLSGYNRIRIQATSRSVRTVEACRSDKRMRLDIGGQGQVIRVNRVGTCRTSRDNVLVTAAIKQRMMEGRVDILRKALVARGFDAIHVGTLGTKIRSARACLGDQRMRVEVGTQGQITRINRVGSCRKVTAQPIVTSAIVPITSKSKIKSLRNSLMMSGFNRIRIKSKSSVLITALACRSEKRMRLDIGSQGQVVRVNRIGTCQKSSDMMSTSAIRSFGYASDVAALRNMLMLSGYNRIMFDESVRTIKMVKACRSEKLMQLDIGSNGKVTRVSRVGVCGVRDLKTAALRAGQSSPVETPRWQLKGLRQVLRQEGYNRISFIDRVPPYYQARGCLSEKEMRIDMSASGRIIRISRIGSCSVTRPVVVETAARSLRFDFAPVVQPTPRKALKGFRNVLRNRGYNRISFIDRTAPHYVAEVCLQEKQMRVDMGASGRIMRVSRIGSCSVAQPIVEDGEFFSATYRGLASGFSGTSYRPAGLTPNRVRVAAVDQTTPIMNDAGFTAIRGETVKVAQQIATCKSGFSALLRARPIRFARATDKIRTDDQQVLDQVIRISYLCPDARLVIGGHTDSDGRAVQNLRLSKKRAQAVARYLINRGMEQSRFIVIGYGEIDPIVPNTTRRNKALNRRIEVTPIVN